MEHKSNLHFLLGANSRYGFYSLYDEFPANDSSTVLYILKGGPGCGKSSFMKKIAASVGLLGYDVEYIHCSGAPSSLDGIYIPQLKTAYMDGTAPHIREPVYPGVSELYIDLGRFYDHKILAEHKDEIKDINSAYKSLYKRSYSLISAACTSCDGLTTPLLTDKLQASIISRAKGIAGREIKKTGRTFGKTKKRFISAMSCDGDIFFEDTLFSLSEKIYLLDNAFGFSHIMIDYLAKQAVTMGYDIILCPSHLDPETPEHLFIPELSLGFLSGSADNLNIKPYRHIRLDAACDPSLLKKYRPHIRRCLKIKDELLCEARLNLEKAGALHDDLESIYNPHVDFNGVYSLAASHIDSLLNK